MQTVKSLIATLAAATLAMTFLPVRAAEVLSENFDAAAALPAGWANQVVVVLDNLWAVQAPTAPNVPAHSGSYAAVFDSFYKNGGVTRLAYTTGVDLSGYGGATVTLHFWMNHDTGYGGANDRLRPQVSTDGTTWTDLGPDISRCDGTTGWREETVDLSAYAGLANVRLGFLGTAAFGNNVLLDDVSVTADAPVSAAPVIDLDAGSGSFDYANTFNEDGPAVRMSDGDFPVTDADDSSMVLLTIEVTGIADGAGEVVTIGGVDFPQLTGSTATSTRGGTTFQIDFAVSPTRTFTVTKSGGGEMPVTDLNDLLHDMTYRDTKGEPTAGTRTFTYRVNDGDANSNDAVSTITVVKVNDGPVAFADAYTTPENTPLIVAAPAGVLANDTDSDSGTLTAFKFSDPTYGTLTTFNADGSFTYVPTPGYHGTDSFTYKANDGVMDSNTGMVTLTVTEANYAGCYNSQAFKGTVTLAANWLNNGNPTNCDAWNNEPEKYDLYMVLCFAPVNCPDCPIQIIDIHQWIVNRNVKPAEIWENGGRDLVADSDMFCIGGVNLVLLTSLDYISADPGIVLAGKRKDKQVSPGFYSTTISSMSGYFGAADVYVNQDLACSEGDQFVYGTVSLNNYKVKLPAAACPTCLSCDNCDLYIDAITAYLEKKYPNADWLSVPN